MGKKMYSERVSNLPKATQLACGRAAIWAHVWPGCLPCLRQGVPERGTGSSSALQTSVKQRERPGTKQMPQEYLQEDKYCLLDFHSKLLWGRSSDSGLSIVQFLDMRPGYQSVLSDPRPGALA